MKTLIKRLLRKLHGETKEVPLYKKIRAMALQKGKMK